MMRMVRAWMVMACLVGCSSETDPPEKEPTDPEATPPAAEPELPVDTEIEAPVLDTDVADPEDDPEDEPTPPDPVPEPVVRFIAMGDGGEGNPDQYAVAAAIEQICQVQGCDFVLYLGDNFYDDGVYSVEDEQFDTKFELPYANLSMPFYVALGNHDFGEIPLQFWRTDYQVEYSDRSTKWNMPDHFYTFTQEHATFIALDTNMIMLGLDWVQSQDAWVDGVLSGSQGSTWRIAYGHHPYRSNGAHGNAGNYEGAWFDITGIVRGDNVQSFFEDHLCGEIDLYLCGHDHNRQWLEPACGVELIVTGAAAKTTDMEHRDGNATLYDDDTSEGFVWIELQGDVMTASFYDKTGALNYTSTVQK